MNVFNLEHFRNLRGIGASELSKQCGFSTNTVTRIENNRVGLSVSRMEEFAKALNISPTWLVCSPVIFNVDNAMDLLRKISTYVGGISVQSNGIISIKSPYNRFLIELKSKRNDLTKSQSITKDEYDEWRLNYSRYIQPPDNYDETEVVIKNIWEYVKQNELSDYIIGSALGAEAYLAGDIGALYRLGERKIKAKQIENFIKYFGLYYAVLADDFTVKDDVSYEHSLLALDESEVGKFLLDDKGSIKFVDQELIKRVLSEKNTFST